MVTTISAAEYAILTGTPKRSKYNAKQVIVTEDGVLYDAKAAKANGITGRRFDSKAEGARYVHLRLLERGGYIRDLQCQVKFDLHGKDGTVVTRYHADFVYLEPDPDIAGAWHEIVEDQKGGKATATPVYKLKAKFLKAEYGVTIREIR
jgi:hypothetical protein